MCAKSFGEFPGIFDNLWGGMGHGVHADDGILQVDENKCGLFRVELEFCHVSSLLKMLKTEDGLEFPLAIEYEDALAFVKSRSRRSTAGTLDAPAGGISGCSRGALCRSRLRSSNYDGGRGAERFFYRRALQLLSGQTVHRVHVGESVLPGGGGALEAVDGAGGDTDPRGVRRSVHRAHHPIRPGASRLSEPAGRANPFSPRPCCPKGFTNRNRKCLSGQESFAFEGTVSTCCKRLSPDSPGHDDALRRSGFQRESPGCG